jgi:LacI family transcriptional regulator
VEVHPCGTHRREGYETVHRIWETPGGKPDALLVANDSACAGALYALLELGVQIPEDVYLVTHANRGIDIFCHVPLTRLEVDPAEFAAAALAELVGKIRGEPASPAEPAVPRLVVGESCGESEGADVRASSVRGGV